MKKLNILFALAMAIIGLSCDDNKIDLYNGPSQIHFVEQGGSMIINDTDPVYTIQVGVSKSVETDRTFEVIIDAENSTAEEGVGFELLSKSITIPAGSVLGEIEVKGLFDGAQPEGDLLRLQLKGNTASDVASFYSSFDLLLYKFCDFHRDAFIGTYQVYEHSFFGEFEYEVEITAGDDPYSVIVDGFWEVSGSAVQLTFDRTETTCSIPSQFFFDEPQIGYENVWIRSLSKGQYNACLGSIEGLEYFVYPGDTPDQGWDRGTFDMVRIK